MVIVDADPSAGTVTLREPTPRLVLRGALAFVVGVGAPLLAERTAEAAVVPALLLTAAACAWFVVSLGRSVVIDDHGVTLSTSRRRPARTPWSDVDGLEVDEGRLVVVRTDGQRLTGPSCTGDELAAVLQDAVLLGLLPGR